MLLQPGDWHVRFRYRPSWLGWTLAVSAIAWLWLGLATIANRRRCSFDAQPQALAGCLRNKIKPAPAAGRSTRLLADTESVEDAIEDIVGVDGTGDFTQALNRCSQLRRNELVALLCFGRLDGSRDGGGGRLQ